MNGSIGVKQRAWIVLAALLVLTVFAMALYNMTIRVNAELFESRWGQEVIALDMMCDNIDTYVKNDEDWGIYDYEQIVGAAVLRLGARQGVFAALYNEQLQLIVGRGNGETERIYNPLITGDNVAIVRANDKGELDAEHVLDGGESHPVRLYYRWIPTGDYSGKLLVAVALSWEELADSPAGVMTRWYVALLVVAAVSVITSAFMLTSSAKKPKEAADARSE